MTKFSLAAFFAALFFFLVIFARNLKLALFSLAFTFFSFPRFLGHIGSGLDPSWTFFINFVNKTDFKFGKDFFFTYGPLGFLTVTRNVGRNVLIAQIFSGLLCVLNFFSVKYLLEKMKMRKENLVFACASLCVFLAAKCIDSSVDLHLCYLALVLTAIIWKEDGAQKIFIFAFDAIFVILFFMKFSSFLMIFASLIVFTILQIFFLKRHSKSAQIKKCKSIAMMYLGIPLSFVAYLFYNPRPASYLSYVRGAYEICMGFNSAMSSFGEGNERCILWIFLSLSIASCVFIFVLLFCEDLKSENDSPEKSALFLSYCASLFFFYKEGFVRHSGWSCFYGIAIVLSILLLIFDWEEIFARFSNQKTKKRFLALSLCVLFAVPVLYKEMFSKSLFARANEIARFGVLAKSVSNDKGEGSAKIPEHFKRRIGKSSAASFPWELSYAADGEMNFVFMPALQNYSAYTPFLDDADARFFSSGFGGNSPEYIIFKSSAIDGRIPLIETPKTFQAIKSNYEIADECAGIFLLRKISSKECELPRKKIASEKRRKNFEDIVRNENAEFCSFKAKKSALGSLFNFLWKTPEVKMRLSFEDGSFFEGRVLLENLSWPIEIDEAAVPFPSQAGEKRKVSKISFSGGGIKFYKEMQIDWF